jgi:hypothetical protein
MEYELVSVSQHVQDMCISILDSYVYIYGTNDFLTGDNIQNRLPHSNGVLIMVMHNLETTCEWFRIEFIPEMIPDVYVYWKKNNKVQPSWNKSVVCMSDPKFFAKIRKLIKKGKQE